jgi:hypothetical protein
MNPQRIKLAISVVAGYFLLHIPVAVVASRIARRNHLSSRRFFLLGEAFGIWSVVAVRKASRQAAEGASRRDSEESASNA